jgi:hypothetical protein
MARADRLAQGTSCAPRKPYPSPSGATYVIFEPLDFIASIEDPAVIKQILAHLDRRPNGIIHSL